MRTEAVRDTSSDDLDGPLDVDDDFDDDDVLACSDDIMFAIAPGLLPPTLPFAADGSLALVGDFADRFPKTTAVLRADKSAFAAVHRAVFQMNVQFRHGEAEEGLLSTAYLASSNRLLTDKHFLPKSRSVYLQHKEREFKEFFMIRQPIVGLTSAIDAPPSGKRPVNAAEFVPELSCSILSDAEQYTRTVAVNPLSGQPWTRGQGLPDLSVLATRSDVDVPSVEPLVPLSFDDDELQCGGREVVCVSYPERLRHRDLEDLLRRLEKENRLPRFRTKRQWLQERLQMTAVEMALGESFNGYRRKILSAGFTLKAVELPTESNRLLVAVTNGSTPSTSGSPYMLPEHPGFLIGQHLGGEWAPLDGTPDDSTRLNYNMFLSVNDPEYVLRYARCVAPTLSPRHFERAQPYLHRHRALLYSHGLLPPQMR